MGSNERPIKKKGSARKDSAGIDKYKNTNSQIIKFNPGASQSQELDPYLRPKVSRAKARSTSYQRTSRPADDVWVGSQDDNLTDEASSKSSTVKDFRKTYSRFNRTKSGTRQTDPLPHGINQPRSGIEGMDAAKRSPKQVWADFKEGFSTKKKDKQTDPRMQAALDNVGENTRQAKVKDRSAAKAALAPDRDFISRHKMALTVVALVCIACIFIYTPAKNYYCSKRDVEVLTFIQKEKEQRAEELKDDCARLQSREGIEDEARKRGLVNDDEVAVTIKGLDDEEQDQDKTDEEDKKPHFTPEVQKLPEPDFKTQALDKFFGYDPENIRMH